MGRSRSRTIIMPRSNSQDPFKDTDLPDPRMSHELVEELATRLESVSADDWAFVDEIIENSDSIASSLTHKLDIISGFASVSPVEE